MDEDLIKAFEEAYAKGNQDLLISNLKFAGYTDDEINGAVSSFKKKREDSSVSGFPSEEEYFALDISENKPRGSSVQLFNAIARGNMTTSEIEKDPEYYNGLYNIYRAYSNDPAVQQLPDALFTEAGEVDSAAFGRLKRDAYRNVQYQIEKDRKDFQEREGKIKERQESYVSVVSPIINGAESILGGVVKFVGEASGFEPATELGNYLLEDVELSSIAGMRNSGLTDEQISKGFLQNMADGDVGVGLSILGPQLLQQVPQLALIAATGGTAGITTLGVSSAGSALREVEDRTDMTSQEKMLYGVGSGIVEGLSERLFAGDIRALRRALGKSDIRQLTTSEFKDRLFSAVPAGVRSTLEEGFEEAVASAAQQTILNFMTGDPIDPIEITEGAIIGSLMGGGTYLASRGIGAVVEPETEKKKRKLNKEIQNLKEKEEDPNIPQDQKGIVKEKREALQNELGDLYSSTDEVVKYMSEKNVEDFKKFRGLQLEIKRAMNEFRTIEDEDISNIQKEKIQNLYNQASEIYKKYASEKEAGVPSPVEEGAPAVQPEPVEVPSPEAPAPSGVLQAPEKEVRPQIVEEEGDDLVLRHGSPYEFDKFLLENVGTGEGRQAFGYGLYFTESSDIAKSYAKKLSEDKTGLLYTVKIKGGKTENWLPWREPVTDGYFDKVQLTPEEQSQYQEYLDKDREDYPPHFEAFKDASEGSEYFVQGSIEAEKVPNSAVYADLADAFGKQKATEILQRSGYSGIVYDSKGGAGDARNFVVFDPAAIEIVEVAGAKKAPAEKAPEAVAPAKREPADALSDVSSEAKKYRDERSKLTIDEALSKKGDELRSSFIDSVVAKFNPRETVSFSYVIPKDKAGTARDKKMDVKLEFYEKDGRTEFKAYINGAPRGSSDTERTRKGTYRSRFADAIGWPLSMVGTSETSVELSGVKAPEAVAPVEEKPELKAAQPESNKQFQEENKRLQDEIVRLMNAEINETYRVRQAIREVQGTNKLAMLDGASVNEGTIDRIYAYYEPLIADLEKELSDLLKQSKPAKEAPKKEEAAKAEEAPKKEEPTVSYLGKAYTTKKGETHLVEGQFTAPDGTITYKVRIDPVTPALGKRKIIDLTANQLEEKITSGEYTERAARIPIVINGGYTAELPADTAKRLSFGKDDVYVVVDTGVTKRTKERKINLKNITKNIGTEFSESDFYKYFNPTGQQYEFNTKTLDYEPKKDKSEPADWVKYDPEGFPAISVADVKRLFPNAANVVLANGKKISQYNDTSLLSAKDVRNLIAKGNSFSYKDKASIDDVTAKLIDLEKINAVLSPLDKRTFAASKKEVIDKINSSRSYSKEQKEILTSLIGTIKGDVLFNFLRPSETSLGLEGASNFYNFGKNILKAKNAPSLAHEIGHWGFYNILSPKDRIEFLRYARDRFKEDVNGERQLAETISRYRSEKGLGGITHSNANASYQEYFATQFTQWMYNEQYTVSEIRTLFEKMLDFVKDYLRILMDKKYNPDLVKYFEKIVQRKEAEIAGEVIDKDDVQEFADEKDSKGDTNVKFNGKKSFIERAVSSIVNQAWTKDQRIVRMFKTNMTSQVNNERRKIINQSKRLDTLLKNADPETLELTRLLMTDGIMDSQLDALARKPNGKAIITQASAMRAYIDSFSEDFISNPAFYRLSPELAITIINNMGSYMRNSYRFWKDDRYEPSERAISEAVAYEFQVLQQMRGAQIAKLFDIEKTREEISESSIDLSIINERIRLIEDEVRGGEMSQADAKKELENLRDEQKEIEDKVISLTKLSENQSALFNELMGDVPMDSGNIAKYQAQQRDYTEKILSQESEEIKKKAEESIQLYLDEIQKIRSGERFKKLGEISPSSIRLPSQEFRQRKSLPDTIKNVLGKETDPIIVFSDTANALSSIKYKGHMLYAISQSLGGDEKYIKNEATEAEKVSGEFRMVTDRFSPLNGRYVHKDIFEALVDPRIYEGNQWWSDIYFKTLLAARKSKVIYNLPTWRKNLTGGWYTIMANGVVNASFISDMQNRAKLMIKGEVDPETEQLIDLAAKYGLMGQSVNANLMGFIDVMYSRANNDGDYRNAYEKVSDAIAGFDQKVGGLYASVDDYTKLIVFRSELDSQAGKLYGKKFDELTKAEKEKAAFEAAELVKKTTPTFSKLPKWYSKIAVLPLGDFVSFELEALRSFGMNIYEGNKDIVKALKDKSLSKEQKAAHIKAGTARLMGSAAIAGLRLSIVAALASAALGDDDELIDDIGAARPNWMEGHSIIPVKISKDGIATVYDYSMEDPYGSFFDLVRDPGSFPEYVTDLLSLNMGVTFLTRLAENKDVYGRDIVESYDDLQTKAYKYTEHTLRSLIIPPFASSAYRDERRRAEAEADQYDRLDALARFASRAIIRDYQYNVGTQFYYFSDQFRTKGKVQYIDLEGSARENRLAELSEIKRMYDAIANIAIQKENMKLLYDARQSVKKKFKAAEEAYILSGYEVPEE